VVRETLAREENAFNETLDRGLELFEAEAARAGGGLSGEFAFKLYDTFGFPPDLTRLLCDERGLGLDMERFEALMEEQRERARAARASAVVRALDLATNASTTFTGDLGDADRARVLEVHRQDDLAFVITDRTPFYAEMGGQAGDTGWLAGADGIEHVVAGVQQIGKARAHLVEAAAAPAAGDEVELRVDPARRRPIEAHHTATHLLHWALHEVVG
jgi:alanyl-tRNA synthetase